MRALLFVFAPLLPSAIAINGFGLRPSNQGLAGRCSPFIALGATATASDNAIEDLLSSSRKIGPVGSLASVEEREKLNDLEQALAKMRGDAA